MNWNHYDNYFLAIHLIDLARIRAYLSEQAAELLSWGRATGEQSKPSFKFNGAGVNANHISRF